MNNTQNNLNKIDSVICPECDTTLPKPKETVLGKIIECPSCGTESEIVELTPIKLSPLEEEK